MPYTAPYVDASGLHLPTYQDILDQLTTQYLATFGQTVYLGNDSADFQDLAVRALMKADVYKAVELAFNNRSPSFAVGTGLDSICKVNGIARHPATYSTCQVVLTGMAGAVITNGIVRDVNGVLWDLPASVTIGGGGTATATATCEQLGSVNALPGDIFLIATPTAGWTGVTNSDPAVVGRPVETDSQLRGRQSISVSLPSVTLFAATVAAIRSVIGVTRLNPIENPTGSPDSNSTPPHSITMVVEGGDDLDIAQAIYDNKSPGCYTNGTTPVTITDANAGITMDIRFIRPAYDQIYVTLGVHSFTGYTSATTLAIRQAVTDYLNDLEIGEAVAISALNSVAMSAMPDVRHPLFSVRSLAAKAGSTPGGGDTADISVAFDHVAAGTLANVILNLV